MTPQRSREHREAGGGRSGATSPRPGLSNPGRRLWPAFTKADLYDYYDAVADRLLPQVADRPVTLLRHPRGVEAPGFYQKDLPDHAPEAIGRFRDWSASAERTVAYALLGSVEALRWCAQHAAVELHPWLARVDAPDRPDTLTFDLDPGERAVPAARAARWLRDLLDGLGLPSMVKTSGKSGLHVLVPIERRYGFGEVRALALAVARLCASEHPNDLTVEMRKSHRQGRLLLDWSRNARGQTIVSAWSPRAVSEGAVATPLAWDEVTDDLDPSRFTLATAPQRPDAWADPPRPHRLERVARQVAERGFPPVDVSPRGKRPIEDRLAEALRR